MRPLLITFVFILLLCWTFITFGQLGSSDIFITGLMLVVEALLVWWFLSLVKRKPSTVQTPSPTLTDFQSQVVRQIETSREWVTVLNDANVMILDTETTTLPPIAEVISVAVIDRYGNELFGALHYPKGSIAREAKAKHGWTKPMLKKQDHMPWPEIHDQLVEILSKATRIVTYNAGFDHEALSYTSSLYGLQFPDFLWYDAMSTYVGEDYDYVKLIDACHWEGVAVENAHSALGDAKMTLELLKAVVTRHQSNGEIPAPLAAHRVSKSRSRSIGSSSSAMATDRQINFIHVLLEERDLPRKREQEIFDNIDFMTLQEASETIDYLKSRPEWE